MIVRVSDNIISPLGMSTAENYTAVKAGRSELKRRDGLWQLPEPFTASLMDREMVYEIAARQHIDERTQKPDDYSVSGQGVGTNAY